MIRNVFRSVVVCVPAEQAFGIWSNFSEYPSFLPDIQQMTVEARLIRCRMMPGHAPRDWTAEVTELTPHRRIAWNRIGGESHRTVITVRPLEAVQTEVSLGAELHVAPGQVDATAEQFDRYLSCFTSFAQRLLLEPRSPLGPSTSI